MNLGGAAIMGGGGPMITGTWINQRTGETVTVRDSYMDGEDMFVILTNGQTLSMDKFSEYIQMSEDEYDTRGNKVSSSSSKKSTKSNKKNPTYDPSLVFDGIDVKEQPKTQTASALQKQLLAHEAEELGINDGYLESTSFERKTVDESVYRAPSVDTKEKGMVSKILDDSPVPSFSFNVEWKGFPVAEMKMLQKHFNVTNEMIAESVIEKYVNIESIKKTITEWVNKVM